MLDPQSPQAKAISDLFNFTMLLALGILALVTGLVVYAIFRFRHKPGQDEEPQAVFGITKLEVGWTVGPLLILGLLMVLVVIAMGYADPASGTLPGAAGRPDTVAAAGAGTAQEQAQAQPDMVIIGHQWWWEVRYPKEGVVTANEIHMPAQTRMATRLESADVIHSFWVPQLSRKMDMTPGFPTQLVLQANHPGVYSGACSEYCGTEHAWMLLRVVVQTQADFDAWMAGQRRPPAMPTSGPLGQGLDVFKSKTCISCHALGELGKAVGPDLSHVGSRTTLGAGILTNTPDNLEKWLRDPQGVKPGILMPNVQLSKDEVQALVAYLESLK
jgi:cytochrome c oxidase subunit 2